MSVFIAEIKIITMAAIKQFENQSHQVLIFEGFNAKLDKDKYYNPLKESLAKEGYQLSFSHGGAWGNPGAGMEYEITKIKKD